MLERSPRMPSAVGLNATQGSSSFFLGEKKWHGACWLAVDVYWHRKTASNGFLTIMPVGGMPEAMKSTKVQTLGKVARRESDTG